MAEEKTIKIPDIGGATDVDVIEVMVKAGDSITKEQALITLEGDKATMDIPSPVDGTVKKVLIKVGDKASQGTVILEAEVSDNNADPAGDDKSDEKKEQQSEPKQSEKEHQKEEPEPKEPEPTRHAPSSSPSEDSSDVYAGPGVRRFARELGVDLTKVEGTGRKDRVSKEDVVKYVKTTLQQKNVSNGPAVAPAPEIDFSQFGTIETKPLNKIKRLTGSNLHRSWVTVPHVTQFDEADITELEDFRKEQNKALSDAKLTLLAFVCKVVVHALKRYPQFNASLDSSGQNLIYKQYYNVGIAVDTPNGLVVPVIKGIDTMSVVEIAMEMTRLSSKARDKGLGLSDMNGGCFTISSLGGIGGTAFTPIVNAPEVAILGLSRSSLKPVYIDKQWQPRLMLPLSLSYDHRIIDGAEAARFTRLIAESLEDLRQLIL